MPPDADALATLVVHTIQKTLTPVLERLAAAEARLAVLPDTQAGLTELRDRVVVVETKAAQPVPLASVVEPVDLAPVLERLAAAEARLAVLPDTHTAVTELRERVVVVETKAAQPAQPVDIAGVWTQLQYLDTQFLKAANKETTLTSLAALSERLAVLEARKPSEPAAPVDLAPVIARLEAVEQRPYATKELWDGMKEQAVYVRDTLDTLRERVAAVEARPSQPGPQGEQGPPGKDGEPGKDGTAGLSYEGVYQDGQTYEKGQIATWGGSSWHANTTTTAKPGESSKDWTLMVKRGRDGKDGINGRDAAMPVVKVGA